MTPLILGFALILLLLVVAVGAIGSVVQGREALQDLCDGAAATAGNAIRPGSADDGNQRAAATAVDDYLRTHTGAPPAFVVTVTADTVQLTCRRTVTPSLYGYLRLPPFDQEISVEAQSSPILRG